jgi:dTDP-3-amino-3,4,6-trideoxy-alpha-D-glucose transaminase
VTVTAPPRAAERLPLPSIPLIRRDSEDPVLFAELMAAVERVARGAAFTLGEEVEAFEREFAAYSDAVEAVGVASGTDALALALRGLGIGPGDEVIVPTNSFIATAEGVTHAGATPRFVDVDPATQLVTADLVAQAIGPRTAAVVPVHLYGRTVDLDPILLLARRHGLAVVEDACQAHGARYKGRRVGAQGDCGCFSFYPAKNLGAWGDGGAVVANDHALADRVRLLRSHGERPRYHHRLVGATARLDALQAAVLRVKLRRLDAWNTTRRDLARVLEAALGESAVELPVPVRDDHDHVFHQFVVRADERDALREGLARRGIATGLHYPVPIHRSEAYAYISPGVGSLPVAEALADRVCSLPMFPIRHGRGREELACRVGEAVVDLTSLPRDR